MITYSLLKRRGLLLGLVLSSCSAAFFYLGARDVEASEQATGTPLYTASSTPGTVPRSVADVGTYDADHHHAMLRIDGRISQGDQDQVIMDLATLQTLTPHRISTSTVVTDGVLQFDGVLMRDVFDYVGANGKTVTATALNGYEVTIPMRDFVDFDVLLAWAADGQPLTINDKGPFWIIYPRDQHEVLQDIRYDYRWVWQLSSLRVH